MRGMKKKTGRQGREERDTVVVKLTDSVIARERGR